MSSYISCKIIDDTLSKRRHLYYQVFEKKSKKFLNLFTVISFLIFVLLIIISDTVVAKRTFQTFLKLCSLNLYIGNIAVSESNIVTVVFERYKKTCTDRTCWKKMQNLKPFWVLKIVGLWFHR